LIHHCFIIRPGWAAIYFAISCSISILFVEFVDPAIDRIIRTQPMVYAAIGEKFAETVLPHPLRLALLLPREDGFFFFPCCGLGLRR